MTVREVMASLLLAIQGPATVSTVRFLSYSFLLAGNGSLAKQDFRNGSRLLQPCVLTRNCYWA